MTLIKNEEIIRKNNKDLNDFNTLILDNGV